MKLPAKKILKEELSVVNPVSTPKNDLVASEERYRRLFESSRDGILILDAETGKIIDVNPFLIELLGYSKSEFIGKEVWEIGFFKDIAASKEKFIELQRKENVRYENLPLETFDGHTISVEFISNVYVVNKTKLIQCNIRDISNRKGLEVIQEATRKVLEQNKVIDDELYQFAENIIDTVREPMLILNAELRVVKASRLFYNFFRVKPEETIGKLIYELGDHQWDIPKLRALLEKILPEKKTFDDYEVEHVFPVIGKRTMLLNARKIRRKSGLEKIILLAFEDITDRKLAEESFAEKERLTNEYLDILFNSAQIPILIWDSSLVIIRVNHAFKELTGYGWEDAENKKIDFLFPKEKTDSSLQFIKNMLIDKKTEIIEVEILTKYNEIKTVLWNSANVFDSEGKIIVATVAQDITKRKKSEEALAVLETRYRRLFESAHDGILIIDAETGKIIDVNPFLVDLLGYPKEDFIDCELWELGFFKDIAANKEKFLELQQKEYVRYDNLPLETFDGRKINVEFVSNVYLCNNIKVIQCNIRDITEHKKAERKLIISENRLRTLVQTIPDLIWLKNVDGVYILCNPMFERFIGAKEADIVGKTAYDFVDKEQANFFRENDNKAISADKPLINEEWLTFADDGHRACLETVKVPIYNEEKIVVGVLGIGRDITERKITEKALQESELRFRNLYQNAKIGLYRTTPDGDILMANRLLVNMLGCQSFEKLAEKNLKEEGFEPSYNREEFLEKIERDGEVNDLESAWKRRDGSTFFVRESAQAIRNSDGKTIYYDGVVEDITERKMAEDEITMLSQSLKSVNECVSITDLEDKILFVNQAFLDTYGYEQKELIGKTIGLVRSEKNEQNQVGEILPSTIKGEWQGELINKRKDGSEFPVYLSTTVVKDKDNKTLGLIGVATDITERKQAEEKLKDNNKFLQTLLKAIPTPVFYKDLKGRYIGFNKAFEQFYGKKAQEFMGKTVFDIAPHELAEIYHAKDMELFKHPGEQVYDTQMKDSQGIIHDVVYHKATFQDSSGKTSGLIGVILDITELKKAVDEIEKKNAFIQTVLDNLPIGIALNKIESGGSFYVNKKFEEIYGWPKDEMKDIVDFFEKVYPDKKYREELLAKVNEDIQSADKTRMHWENCIITHKDGSTHTINAVNIPLFDQNTMVSTVLDITERKQMEIDLIAAKDKAEENDRLKTAFLANMSHEIRTPMNGIIGFTDLLKSPKLTGEEQQEYISIIEQSGDRLINIINNIINISKIESGQIESVVSETNVNEQVEFIYNFFKPLAEEKDLQIFFKNSLSDIESQIFTDTDKILAILTNLVNNAIKFTAAGYIEFGYNKKGNFLEFYVKDTGVGIPQEQNEIIFERFRQGSESLSRDYEGAGLGLSISKAYVEMLGGKIWVEVNTDSMLPSWSDEKRGSIFYFTIPYKPVNNAKTSEETSNINEPIENKIGKLKILIAEDDEISKELIAIVTKDFSREIVIVGNGYEAVEACKNNPDFDLVLMDIKMPVMDGFEATRQIRQFNKDLIIVAQTAFAFPDDKKKAINSGCNDFITKPIRKDVLINILNTYFKD